MVATERQPRQDLHLGVAVVCPQDNTRKCSVGVQERRPGIPGDSFTGMLGPALGAPGVRTWTRTELHKDDSSGPRFHQQPKQWLRGEQADDNRMEAEWTPRERNQEADDLSKLLTSNFGPSKEVKMELERQSWLVLPALLQSGQKFQKQKELEVEQRRRKEQGMKRKEDKLKFQEMW